MRYAKKEEAKFAVYLSGPQSCNPYPLVTHDALILQTATAYIWNEFHTSNGDNITYFSVTFVAMPMCVCVCV